MKVIGLRVFSKNVNLSKGGVMLDRLKGNKIRIKALENIKAGDFCFMFTKDGEMKDWFLTKNKINDEYVDELYESTMMKSEFATLEHSVVGLKVLNVLEKKGGDISINEFSDDTLYTETSTDYVLKKQFDISTPSPPAGLIVYKYALMVSVQIYHVSQVSKVKIDVDDVQLDELTTTTTKTWYDRSKEVSSGSHTVKIYLRTTVAGGTCKVEGIKAVCGIGTTSTSDVKVAEVETCGEGLGSLGLVGKSYGENATISGKAKVDDCEYQKVDVSTTVTKGGSSYSAGDNVAGNPFSGLTYYGKTSTGNIPMFSNYTRTIVRRMHK